MINTVDIFPGHFVYSVAERDYEKLILMIDFVRVSVNVNFFNNLVLKKSVYTVSVR